MNNTIGYIVPWWGSSDLVSRASPSYAKGLVRKTSSDQTLVLCSICTPATTHPHEQSINKTWINSV